MSDMPTIDGKRVYGDTADPEGPWLVGTLLCRSCGHKWVCVRPFSVTDLLHIDCDGCGSFDLEDLGDGDWEEQRSW